MIFCLIMWRRSQRAYDSNETVNRARGCFQRLVATDGSGCFTENMDQSFICPAAILDSESEFFVRSTRLVREHSQLF